MALAVNLLKNRHSLSEADYQKEQLIYKYSVVALTGVMVVTIAIAIWQFVLTRQLNKIEIEISNSNAELSSLSEASAMQLYLKSRLKLITNFLDDRAVSRQALQRVFSIEIPGVIVTSVSFESENLLKVQATSRDILSFDKLVDYVSGENEFFLQLVSKQVIRQDNGEYLMDLFMTIPKT